MSSALYDGFIADYYAAAPMVAGRLRDVAFYCDGCANLATRFSN